MSTVQLVLCLLFGGLLGAGAWIASDCWEEWKKRHWSRNHPDARFEIRRLADDMERQMETIAYRHWNGQGSYEEVDDGSE